MVADKRLATLQQAIERYYEVHEIAYGDCPARFFVGIPTLKAPAILRDPPKLATGRAFSRDAARGGCVGEVAEALCLCEPEDSETVQARVAELDGTALLPGQLAQYGSLQIDNRKQWNATYGEHAWVPEPFDPRRVIDWVKARSLRGDAVYVPAACCYLDHPEQGQNGGFAVADSNGCAVAWTLDEALLRGFLELVERDAVGIWWYGMHQRPAVDIDELQDERLQLVQEWHRDRGRSFAVLDLTTDFAIPVCAAVSADAHGSNVSLGFGAALDTRGAVSAACAEMLQLELSMHLIAQARRSDTAMETTHTKMLDTWRRLVSLPNAPQLQAAEDKRAVRVTKSVVEGNPAEVLAWCEHRCRRMGLSLWLLDLSRADLPVRAARVIVPGMCHYKAQLGVNRLYQTPLTLAWCSQRRGEEELNPVPLLT